MRNRMNEIGQKVLLSDDDAQEVLQFPLLHP